MQETDQLTGDFANTSDQLANSQRILKAEFENTKAEAGQALLPIMQELVGFINRKGLPAFKDFIDRVTGLIEKAREFWQTHGPQLKESFDRAKTALDATKESLQPVAQLFKDLFGEIENGTSEQSGIFTFANMIEGLTLILEGLNVAIRTFLIPFREFDRLMIRLSENPLIAKGNKAVESFINFGAGFPFKPGQFAAGPETTAQPRIRPGLPVLGPVQGANRPNINITINGALDREGTARDINRILNDSARRTGATQNLVFAP
jgi:hypothetical protein